MAMSALPPEARLSQSPEVSPLVITLATQNEGKRRELCQLAADSGLPVSFVLPQPHEEIAETGQDFLANAWLKAKQTPPVSGTSGLVLAEDSGLVVEALAGQYGLNPFPGLHSNRWLTPQIREALLGRSFENRMPLDRMTAQGVSNSDLCQGILTLMQEQTNRTARYCCGMVLWHPQRGECFQVMADTELRVIEGAPRGLNGFGYDPIMALASPLPDFPSDTTLAEMPPDVKNQVSHRGRAFQQVLRYLQTASF